MWRIEWLHDWNSKRRPGGSFHCLSVLSRFHSYLAMLIFNDAKASVHDRHERSRISRFYSDSPVWHYALTKEQTYQIERIQKRAIHIIFNFSRGMPYTSMLYSANLDTLATRRNDNSQKFFLDITQPSSCLHYLFPPTRDQSVISRLRTSANFQESTPAPSATVHSLHLNTRIKHKLSNKDGTCTILIPNHT